MSLICLIPDQHHLAKQLADTSVRTYFIVLLYFYLFLNPRIKFCELYTQRRNRKIPQNLWII